MSKQSLVIQLVFNGNAVWRVKTDVPADICRKMTNDELEAFGKGTGEVLADIIRTSKGNAAAEPAPKKDKSERGSKR